MLCFTKQRALLFVACIATILLPTVSYSQRQVTQNTDLPRGDKSSDEKQDNNIDGSNRPLLPSCPASSSDTWDNCHGSITFDNGTQKYIGEFRMGKKDGYGTLSVIDPKVENGKKYVGEFKDDKRNGRGTLYNSDGSVSASGNWIDDKFVNEFVEYEIGSPANVVTNLIKRDIDHNITVIEKQYDDKIYLTSEFFQIEQLYLSLHSQEFDADPITGTQELDGLIIDLIDTKKINAITSVVSLEFKNDSMWGYGLIRYYKMLFVPGVGWRIDDIIYVDDIGKGVVRIESFRQMAAKAQTAQSLCAGRGTDDKMRPIPESLHNVAETLFGNELIEFTVYRCFFDTVLICNNGGGGCDKPNISAQSQSVQGFCRNNPSSSSIPGYVTGHTRAFEWQCVRGRPIKMFQYEIDQRGFLTDNWTSLLGIK